MFNTKLTRLKRQLRQLVLLGLALLLLQTSLTAAPSIKHPLAPPDTSSPQATLRSFVENVNRAHQSVQVSEYSKQAKIFFQRAQRCLNLSEIPQRLREDVAEEGTLLLKEILDRIEVPPYDRIPDASAVAADKEFSKWTLPKTEIDIVKVESGPRAGEFLFSSATVARLDEFYQKVKELPYKPGATEGIYQLYVATPGVGGSKVNKWFLNLPSWLNTRHWGQTLWQWISLGISLLIAVWIPYRIFGWHLRRATTLAPPQRTRDR
ncbi:MAG: hypothetical protein AB4038_18110, partial [Prochloraceae cyanobacterium]